ncbi:uncharacterized protein LOC123297613 isoform X2 [Chrysoperla carnea]|uniref:uncharacterized protein LOC123297613 isoform X2 n=1 Tax=Chrysoperla carnea TaxID=189513 RepID=UPI001D06B4FB|nr:uncharacterized protein LOC123297613 isoform X2 [Chrysoperla carnea]
MPNQLEKSTTEMIKTEKSDRKSDHLNTFKQSEENIKDVDSEIRMITNLINRENELNSIGTENQFDILNSFDRLSTDPSNIQGNDRKGNQECETEQLCRDMQQKLHLQTTDTKATGDNNAHPKSPTFGRPRSEQSIITAIPNINSLHQKNTLQNYIREQNNANDYSSVLNEMNNSNISESSYLPICDKLTKEHDFGTALRSTNSTPNTTSKVNEYFPDYDPNNSGTDLRMLNQSSSDFDFTSKYFSTRATEFEPSGFQFGQNNVFRTKDYINGKTNKETQINQNTNNLPSWRINSRLNTPSKVPLQLTTSNTLIPTIPPPLSAVNFYNTDEMQHYTAIDNWRDHELLEPSTGGAMATPHGTITLRLHDRVRVDMTLDRAVRVVNFKNNIVVSVSATGAASGLLHPNGRVYQYGSRVEIMAHDQHSHNNKYAKMWYKGVSFTSDQCALVYLVDSAGTRTTTDTFSDLSQDFSLSIFYNESRHGPQFVQEAMSVLQSSQYWITEDGTENWIINNVRISQTSDGLVRIGRNSNKFSLRTSPANGSASVSSPYVHCTGSLGQTSHLFVRRGERRMHYDGASFIVRNAGHSAGFDDKHQLKVY